MDKKKRTTIKTVFLVFLSSILSILAYPPYDFWPCAFVALVPLFFAIERSRSKKEAAWIGFLAAFVHYMGLIFWLRHVVWVGLLFAVFLCAVYYVLFALAARQVVFTDEPSGANLPDHPLLRVCTLAALWVAFECIRGEIPFFNFGWALLSYSQTSNVTFIQIADVVGAYGVSFVVVLINGCVFYFMKTLRRNKKKAMILFADLVCIFLIVYGYGLLKLSMPITGRDYRVGVVQGNIAQEIKWHPAFKDSIIDTYVKLIEFISYDKPDLIILPEAAYPGNFLAEFESSALNNAIREYAIPVVIGGIRLPRYGQEYNSAFLMSGAGKIIEAYNKMVLVPFGEYIPFKWFFSLFGLTKFAYSLGVSDFDHGKEYTVFSLPTEEGDVRFSTLICFEDLFPRISRRFVRSGAEFLVVITNDAWYKKTAAAHQHLQASIFRAVENNIHVVRSANTGVSGFISPRGELLNTVKDKDGNEIFVAGGVSRPLTIASRRTVFQYGGFAFKYLCVLFVLCVLYMRGRGEIHK